MENKRRISFEFLIILFFTVCCILPAAYASIPFYLMIAAYLFYIVYLFLKKDRIISKREILILLGLIVYMAFIYTVLTDTTTISEEASNREIKQFMSKLYQYMNMFIPILFLDWATKRSNAFERKAIIGSGMVLMFYTMITTIRELMVNARIAREWTSFEETAKDNVAGYTFVYAIPFLIVLFVYLLKNFKKPYNKVLAVAAIAFQLYFIVLSQYTIALIMSVLGLLYMLYIKIKNRNIKILFLILLPIAVLAIPIIIKVLAARVPSEDISIRLNEIYDFITGSNKDGYNLNGRLNLYGKAIKAFLSSPVIGNRTLDFDGHATFLSVFARTGLLGGIAFVLLLKKSKTAVNRYLGAEKRDYSPFWFMLLLMGFTNPIHSSTSVMFVILFLVPLTMKQMSIERQEIDGKEE